MTDESGQPYAQDFWQTPQCRKANARAPNRDEPERLLAKHTASKTSQPERATFCRQPTAKTRKLKRFNVGKLRLRRGKPLTDFNVRR